MTWRIFIEKIRESELLNKTSKDQIVIQLFKAAGCMADFSPSAAKTWINDTRECKAITYFPDNKLNNVSGAIKFFRNRNESKLQRLQKLFSKVGDKDSPIDVETNDMDILCRSLVNQFLDLLGFQRLDTDTLGAVVLSPSNESAYNVSTSCKRTETSQDVIPVPESAIYENLSSSKNVCDKFESAYDKEMIALFKEIAEYCKIKDLIDRNPSLIYFRNAVLNYDILSLADCLVDDVRCNILTFFEPYKKELTYIRISRFVMLVSEYKEYLRHNLHINGFPHNWNPTNSNQKSEFEVRTERYRKQLEDLYNELLVK